MDNAKLRDSVEFEALAKAINRSRCGNPIDFYASPGNWGDSLLNEGSRQMFAAAAIPFHEKRRSDLPMGPEAPGILAVIGGGGGWNKNWKSTPDFVAEVLQKYKNAIVLPSTFDTSFISDQKLRRAKLYTRARTEHQSLVFCHDMAFYLEAADMALPTVPFPLLAFRRDKERSEHAPDPDRNWDISLLGTAEHDSLGFIELVARFPQVYTDRLHIAIAAAIAGRETFLYDGNYGKNRGVYEASIRDNFAHVSMVEWQHASELDKVVGMLPIGIPGYEG